jgi:hypothetical protein
MLEQQQQQQWSMQSGCISATDLTSADSMSALASEASWSQHWEQVEVLPPAPQKQQGQRQQQQQQRVIIIIMIRLGPLLTQYRRRISPIGLASCEDGGVCPLDTHTRIIIARG